MSLTLLFDMFHKHNNTCFVKRSYNFNYEETKRNLWINDAFKYLKFFIKTKNNLDKSIKFQYCTKMINLLITSFLL